MSKRNAHAVAARQRKAGAHKEAAPITCDECGRDMGYQPPSHLCAPCSMDIKLKVCPVCEKKELTGCGVYNAILGEVCSIKCLEDYWQRAEEHACHVCGDPEFRCHHDEG